MEKTATISECGKYRYRLGRRWGDGRPLVFVMLNPSTADASDDDPTIRRCIGFARSHGYNAIDVVNLYAWRATDPRDLKAAGYPVGPDNDKHIIEAVMAGGQVCCAWGSRAAGLSRPDEVLRMVRRLCSTPQALAFDSRGIPRHPLMLASDCTLQPIEPAMA